jgi:predicted dienelactone hydrolase
MRRFWSGFFALLLTVALAACGSDGDRGALAPVADPALLGTFAVGHATGTFVDETRNDRPLPVNIWYPSDPSEVVGLPPTVYELAAGIGLVSPAAVDGSPVARGAYRLVIFSHGFGGIGTQSTDLVETLASHGFIVVAPEHTGNTQSDMSDSFDQAAAKRVPDVTFLIDTIFARGRDTQDVFYERVDESAVGVVGHSFGGMTAVGCAAGWAGAAADPRVGAIVPISAVIDAELQSDARSGPNAGFTAEQLGRIVVPALLIGGTADVNVFIENNAIAFEEMTAAPRVYKLDIVGANHTHFANVCDIGSLLLDLGLGMEVWPIIGAEALLAPFAATCSPAAFPIEEVVRLQNLYVVAFFKRHLNSERGYDRYLSEAYAATEPDIAFESR